MTAVASPAHAYRTPRINGRQTYLRAVRSEWSKLTTLRSTWVTSAMVLFITVGLGVAIITSYAGRPVDPSMVDAPVAGAVPEIWHNLVIGASIAQLVVACLGALMVTGEYSSGQIRSTLAAVPRRGHAFWAKALVVSGFSFGLGIISSLLIWALASLMPDVPAISPISEHFLPYALGVSVLYAFVALMSLGYGYLFRSTAGAIATVLSLMFVINIPLGLASTQWKWAEIAANLSLMQVTQHVASPLPSEYPSVGLEWYQTHTTALIAFAVWVIVPTVAGWLTFLRRDA